MQMLSPPGLKHHVPNKLLTDIPVINPIIRNYEVQEIIKIAQISSIFLSNDNSWIFIVYQKSIFVFQPQIN